MTAAEGRPLPERLRETANENDNSSLRGGSQLTSLLRAAADALTPAIPCPVCGEQVRQVASATLELALWQHQNWACKKGALTPAPVLERLALENCYMMAKREIARLLKQGGPEISLERWQHVRRFCEDAGCTSGVLRESPAAPTRGAQEP